MKIFFNDPLFDGQLLRTLNHVYHHGADVGECMATAARIKDKDTAAWYREWTATADRFFKQGQRCEQGGHRISARESYLKASNYYRTSYIFMMNNSDDKRLKEAYLKQKDAFRNAIRFFDTPVETVSIPYEGKNLPGYFLKAVASDEPRPTLIITGGYDCPAEELIFFSGADAIERGYNCIIFDGPGQGGALIEQNMYFRPDWENVITPVVDYLFTRKDVKQDQIALMGISFGGYLAPRAASSEHRISALIADPAQIDLYEAIQTRMPAFILNYLQSESKFKNKIANRILNKVIKDPVKGWSLRRGLYVHGVPTIKDYVKISKKFNSRSQITKISCPTLVCDAENDEISAFAKKVYDTLNCKKTYIRFTNYEGAGEHCEDGNRSLFNQRVFDWMDELYVKN